jgi:hypothetical protein
MTDAPGSPAEFEQAFAAADPATQTAFVADLWAVLGWETSVEGNVVVADRSEPTSETRRLLVSPGEHPPAEADVDVLVTPDGSVPTGFDIPAIGAAGIRDRALYGADRSATAPVFRHHLDRELSTDPPGDGSDPGSPSDAKGEPPSSAAVEQPPVTDEDGPPEGTDDATEGTTDASHEVGAGDDGPPGESEDASDRNVVTAGRVAVTLLAVVLVVGGVGFAAGMLPPLSLLENQETNAGVNTTATPDRDVVPNGSAARYASLRPTCERPPELVIKIQVGAFGRNSELDGDGGIWTAYRFASPENRATTGPQVSFVRLIKQRYAIMLRHESVEYGDAQLEAEGGGENTSRTLTQRVTLTDGNGTETAFLWSVSKQEGGEYDGCWMTSGVRRVSSVRSVSGG